MLCFAYLDQVRYCLQAEKRIRLDGDAVFGYKVEHPDGFEFQARGEQGALDADIAEDEFMEGDGDLGWLCEEGACQSSRTRQMRAQLMKGKRGLLAHLSDLDHSSMHLCVLLSALFFLKGSP